MPNSFLTAYEIQKYSDKTISIQMVQIKKKKKALKDFSLVFNQNLHKQKIGVQIHLIHAIIKVGLRGKLIAIPPVCLSVTTQQLI